VIHRTCVCRMNYNHSISKQSHKNGDKQWNTIVITSWNGTLGDADTDEMRSPAVKKNRKCIGRYIEDFSSRRTSRSLYTRMDKFYFRMRWL
jgi:hypothetical protein